MHKCYNMVIELINSYFYQEGGDYKCGKRYSEVLRKLLNGLGRIEQLLLQSQEQLQAYSKITLC